MYGVVSEYVFLTTKLNKTSIEKKTQIRTEKDELVCKWITLDLSPVYSVLHFSSSFCSSDDVLLHILVVTMILITLPSKLF